MKLVILLICFIPTWILSQNCTHVNHFKTQHSLSQQSEFQFSHLKLEINASFLTDTLYGKTTWTFHNKNQNNQIFFQLNPALQINNISENGQPLTWHRSLDSISITIDSNIEHSIVIDYQGVPMSSGFGSYMKSEHTSGKIIWTLSEPYGAKDWFPVRENLIEKIDSSDIFITTDSGYVAVSNGLLISQVNDNEKVTYHWKHKHPIAYYLLAFTISNYLIYKNVENGIQWENYVFPHDSSHFLQSWGYMPQIMEIFENLTIPYPFRNEKYGHAQFPWQGGMEHQTISFMYNFTFELVAHELAHQWFGDYVTCSSWNDLWLNEGFASYGSGLAWEKLQPDFLPVFLSYRLKKILEKPDGTVYCHDPTMVNDLFSGRLRYHKSCMVLHQLRGQMGDESFFNAVKSYQSDPTLAYSNAQTEDFLRHVQKYAPFSAEKYFKQWIYGEGQPTFTINYAFQNNKTLLKIGQKTSHESVPFFELKIPVRIYSQNLTDSLDIWLEHKQNNQIFEINTTFLPDSITFDPTIWIIADTTVYQKWDLPDYVFYPNPSINEFQIIDNENITEIEILDISGKMVFKDKPNTQSYQFTQEISQGIYFVRWKTNVWNTVKWLTWSP